MRTCEYATRPPFAQNSVRPDYYQNHGLEMRSIDFPPHGEIHAVQMNYGELVLWRRWICGASCSWNHGGDIP